MCIRDRFPTTYDGDIGKKKGREKLLELRGTLAELQELLFAEHKQKVLIVLQGIDTSGKDGTIAHEMCIRDRWKGSGATGKNAGGLYYLPYYMHEQSQTQLRRV